MSILDGCEPDDYPRLPGEKGSDPNVSEKGITMELATLVAIAMSIEELSARLEDNLKKVMVEENKNEKKSAEKELPRTELGSNVREATDKLLIVKGKLTSILRRLDI